MRFLLLYLALMFSLPTSCYSQNTNEEDSLRLLIPEKPPGWVIDFELVFTTVQINFLDSLIQQHKVKTSNELALVTLELDSTEIKTGEMFDQFSLLLFRQWGVGEKDKNNGVGILFSVKLRKIRIEVGYGLNGKLTDQEAKKIIDNVIIPEFKKADYFKGISNGLLAIFKEIE